MLRRPHTSLSTGILQSLDGIWDGIQVFKLYSQTLADKQGMLLNRHGGCNECSGGHSSPKQE